MRMRAAFVLTVFLPIGYLITRGSSVGYSADICFCNEQATRKLCVEVCKEFPGRIVVMREAPPSGPRINVPKRETPHIRTAENLLVTPADREALRQKIEKYRVQLELEREEALKGHFVRTIGKNSNSAYMGRYRVGISDYRKAMKVYMEMGDKDGARMH